MRNWTGAVVAVLMLSSGFALAQEATPPPSPAPAATPAPAAPAPAAPATASAPANLKGEVKIICDGKVKGNGELTLVFTPSSGEAKSIKVTLAKGMSKSEVCRDIEKELTVMLGGMPYKVDKYDDDKVKVEGKDDAKLGIALGGMSATGITIELK